MPGRDKDIDEEFYEEFDAEEPEESWQRKIKVKEKKKLKDLRSLRKNKKDFSDF